MSQAASPSHSAPLSEELVVKLRQVEVEVDRLEKTKVSHARWFWLGFIPGVFRWFVIIALAGQLAAPIVWYVLVAPLPGPALADITLAHVLVFIGRLAGTMFMLLISTWAKRYCEAKADGKL